MIVAAGAGHGQPQHAARNHIDAVVDSFGKALREFAAETQEPESGQVAAILRMRQNDRPPADRVRNRSYGRSSLSARITQSRYV